MKNYFAKQSEQYAQFRPSYPDELFDFLISLAPSLKKAWDAGTGNGQFASKLADYFEKVIATDISKNQINNAVKKNNIIYKAEKAEQTSSADNEFDLITVAQAIHWFDFAAFYKEVNRTLKPDGIFAVVGYSIVRIEPEINKIIDHFYSEILNPYWDEKRKYIDDSYKTIPFPFFELSVPSFSTEYLWNLDQLYGFLTTWSAVRNYITQHHESPLDKIIVNLKNCWGESLSKKVTFPVLLRVGRK